MQYLLSFHCHWLAHQARHYVRNVFYFLFGVCVFSRQLYQLPGFLVYVPNHFRNAAASFRTPSSSRLFAWSGSFPFLLFKDLLSSYVKSKTETFSVGEQGAECVMSEGIFNLMALPHQWWNTCLTLFFIKSSLSSITRRTIWLSAVTANRKVYSDVLLFTEYQMISL